MLILCKSHMMLAHRLGPCRTKGLCIPVTISPLPLPPKLPPFYPN